MMIRGIYIIAGWLFVVIGIIGVVTPLLPSTPFLLLASACFARGGIGRIMLTPIAGQTDAILGSFNKHAAKLAQRRHSRP
jgi:hypothetical protein